MNKNTDQLMPLLDALWMLRWGVKSSDEGTLGVLGEDFLPELDKIIDASRKLVYGTYDVKEIASDYEPHINSWVEFFENAIDSLPQNSSSGLPIDIGTENEFNFNVKMTFNARKAMYGEIFDYINDLLLMYKLKSESLDIATKDKIITMTEERFLEEQQKLAELKNKLVNLHKILTDRYDHISDFTVKGLLTAKAKQQFQKEHYNERKFLKINLRVFEKKALANKIITQNEYKSIPPREEATYSEKQLYKQLNVDRDNLLLIKNFIDKDLRKILELSEPELNQENNTPTPNISAKRPRTNSKH